MYKIPGLNGSNPQFVTITPRIAAQWLKLNTSNRNLRESAVAKYARDIREGRWVKNGDSIRFSATGKLLDGQHRLSAIIDAGTPVEMLVIPGLADETQATMDIGARRTSADALTLNGVQNSTIVAAIVKRVLMWDQGDHRLSGNTAPTHAEIQEFFHDNADAMQRSAEVARRAYQGFKDIPPSISGTAHYVTSRIDSGTAAEFFSCLGTGAGLMEGNPILAVRHKAMVDARAGRAVPEWQRLAHIFHGWNSVRAGKTLTRMILPKEGVVLPK